MTFRSGNPALSNKTFQNIQTDSISNNSVMTLDGAVNKIAISLMILLLCSYYTYSTSNTAFIMFGFVGGLIMALITIFKKTLSPYTVPLYAVFEGLALGGISAIYNHMYTGIVQQAVFLTFGIFIALIFAYKTRIIQPSENFKLGIFAATAGIGIVYIASFIMSFFGSGLSIMNPQNASLISIGFSFFVVVIASLNLVLDFDFIEQGAEMGVPKYMEWYAAFGLLVTLIWLYLEILRLLAKLQSRRD